MKTTLRLLLGEMRRVAKIIAEKLREYSLDLKEEVDTSRDYDEKWGKETKIM